MPTFLYPLIQSYHLYDSILSSHINENHWVRTFVGWKLPALNESRHIRLVGCHEAHGNAMLTAEAWPLHFLSLPFL